VADACTAGKDELPGTDTMGQVSIRTPDQRLRVFVSSTLQELAADRRAVREAIESLRLTPVMFEQGARPHPPRALYRAYLAQSDVFIGLYWERYGWVAPGEEVSGLEDEYGLSGDRPKLIYLKTPAPNREPRLSELIARIRRDDRVSYRAFSDPDELRSLVADDLAVLLTERFSASAEPRAGPSRSGRLPALPRPPTRLIGRDGDVARVLDLLADPDTRMVTLLADWGWPEHALPGYARSHVHPSVMQPDQMVLISTFRLPVQIHTRGGNAKWLNELAHTNPLWIHPDDARRLGVGAGDLVRVETAIGYFVVKAWVTEGIRPGVVACSHHMGRWKLAGDRHDGAGQVMATVDLAKTGEQWAMSRRAGVRPYASADPDTRRIWWTDVGVHQNLTFPVHPDPISGQHCWHQAVQVRPAEPADAYGDIAVDTHKAHEVYQQWLAMARNATRHSPDRTRRPYWLMRPLKPSRDTYRLAEEPATDAAAHA